MVLKFGKMGAVKYCKILTSIDNNDISSFGGSLFPNDDLLYQKIYAQLNLKQNNYLS
jgi:hypothetical protein